MKACLAVACLALASCGTTISAHFASAGGKVESKWATVQSDGIVSDLSITTPRP